MPKKASPEEGRGELLVPYAEAARRFYLPQWVAFDDKDKLLVNSTSEAEAHIASMQRCLRRLPVQDIEAPATAAPDYATGPAIENNRLLLARKLRVDPATIQVISAEKGEWSDSCLGLGLPAESCAAVITPGYKITFGVAGQEYVIHTDAGGYQTRVAAAPVPATGETIIAWSGTLEFEFDAGNFTSSTTLTNDYWGLRLGGPVSAVYFSAAEDGCAVSESVVSGTTGSGFFLGAAVRATSATSAREP